MLLAPAVESEFAEIVALANLAFRGAGPDPGWSTESQFIDGQRLTEPLLREDLAAKPQAVLLTYRESAASELLGTVWLEPRQSGAWYLGLLTVRPDRQKQQLGRSLLAAAEAYAGRLGAERIRMSVLNVRTELIAWYERRGYRQTGEIQSFSYADQRFGRPLRGDLHFVLLEKTLD
jgi:ribosomal protein S18 acetylase RimI-like enzyme